MFLGCGYNSARQSITVQTSLIGLAPKFRTQLMSGQAGLSKEYRENQRGPSIAANGSDPKCLSNAHARYGRDPQQSELPAKNGDDSGTVSASSVNENLVANNYVSADSHSPAAEPVREASVVVAEAAHELRLPIANIKLLVETLLDGALDEREVCKRMLKRIYQETERLHALVSDLLSLEQVAERRH